MHSAPALKEFLAYVTKLKTTNPTKKIVLVTYRNSGHIIVVVSL